MLADRRRAGIRTIPSILKVFKLILHYCHNKGRVTDILITINPSHEIFYTRYLPFKDFAGLRHYPSVKGAPALAKRQNLRTLFEEHKNHKLYDFFIDSAIPQEILEAKYAFTPDQLRELFVVQRQIFQKLPGFALEYVKGCYPEYDFESIMAPAAI
jgi:predicted metal-binding protein